MNTPVNFELAKLLKEKGFNDQTLHFYTKPKSKMFGIDEHNRYYNIVNTPKKLYTCGEHSVADIKNVYSAPTIADVVMWLYEKHGVWIETPFWDSKFRIKIINTIEEKLLRGIDFEGYNSPTEAYEAAIKYCLTELI